MSGRGIQYWVGFSKVSGIGASRLRALIDYFGDLETAWNAHGHDLQQAGLDRRSLEIFANDGQVAMEFCFAPEPDNTTDSDEQTDAGGDADTGGGYSNEMGKS